MSNFIVSEKYQNCVLKCFMRSCDWRFMSSNFPILHPMYTYMYFQNISQKHCYLVRLEMCNQQIHGSCNDRHQHLVALEEDCLEL